MPSSALDLLCSLSLPQRKEDLMALTPKQKKRVQELYTALKKKNKYVASLYDADDPPEDPLQRHASAAYGNTFLHMAIRFREFELVDLLLEKLAEYTGKESLSNIKNNDGNTILHELAANDDSEDRAAKVMEKDPELLIALNNLGETPIFSAVRHRKYFMLGYLTRLIKQHYPENVKKHLQREDKTTVLHIAIATEHFDMAKWIAKWIFEELPDLIIEKDQDGMTAFQHLACNQRVFAKKKKKREGFLEDNATGWRMTKEDRRLKDSFKEAFLGTCQPEGYDDGLQSLVRILVKNDTAWLTSIDSQVIGSDKSKELKGKIVEFEIELSQEKSTEESHGKIFSRKESIKVGRQEKSRKNDESPLFLAVMSNIPEIVEEIILQYPHVLELVNKEGMNILQVAILYGSVQIFELLVNSQVLPNSLLSVIDDEGNSLAHMVGQNKRSEATQRMQNPAMQLRKECMFFQKVKSACNMHLIKPLNDNHQTAEESFATRNCELHRAAKEWLLRTTENCTILSVFIATVAFAAAYTVPGGPDQNTGIPLLNSRPWFMVFIIADVISLALALTSVGIFLSILTSSFPLTAFENYLFKKLRGGIISMVLSVSMMAVAFGATIVLTMTHNWENVVWIVVGFLPVPIFFLSYSPLRSEVLEPFTEAFTTFAARFLFCALVLFIVLLVHLPQEIFTFIKHKLDSCKCGQKSNIQSPHPSQV